VTFLVDTNVVGELARPRPNQSVLTWASQVRQVSLSAITIEEIHYGLAWKPNERIRSWFERFLEEHCRVLPVTDGVARQAGVLRGRLRARGVTQLQADMLIAATAISHGLTLVTRNAGDFEGCGVTVLDPFS